jgi:hypothetical protein
MKRHNWALLVLLATGLTTFVLSRTIWGPPSGAAAAEPAIQSGDGASAAEAPSDARLRYISNQPRHWRYVMLKH